MTNRLNFKQKIIIASTLFGMFFGAGNLIFPIHLGQISGCNFIPASIGFVISAVVLPIAGVVAIAFSDSNGLFGLASKANRGFAYFFTTLLYLTIGPFFAIPRCASLSFTTGIEPLFGNVQIIFSIIFFVVVLILSLKPKKITTWIGKIINPIFLFCLFVLVVVVLFNFNTPIENIEPIDAYKHDAFFNGFLEGYKTMDAIAGLAFGIIIVNIVKSLGVKNKLSISRDVFKSGNYTIVLMGLIYVLTIIMGVQSRALFEISENGGIALAQISNYYFNSLGNIILAITITLACLKTSIGLVTSCSTAFVEMFPKVLSYKKWAVIFTVFSLLISNIGLTAIIDYSIPVLNFLYSLSIVLILLAFAGPLFKHNKYVYIITLSFTLIPSIFEFIMALPVKFEFLINFYLNYFPFADIGFGWLIPAIIGFTIGIIYYVFAGRKVY